MIDYDEIEKRIKNCVTEEDLLMLEDEIIDLLKENPKLDSDRLYFQIADRRKFLQEHICDPWSRMK